MVGNEIDEDHAQQGEHRPDRQIDAAGDDGQALADGKNAEQAYQVGHVEQVHRRQELRIEHLGYGTDHHQQKEQTKLFFGHQGGSAGCWPMARWSTLYSLNWGRSRTPLMAPSCITAMRSDTPITSSISEEIIRMDTPWSARSRMRI